MNCIACKGRDPEKYCGRSRCPIISRAKSREEFKPRIKQDYSGSSVSPFVGRFGYPKVNVGIMTPPDEKDGAWEYDAPSYWSENNYDINKIIGLRSSLINSKTQAMIKDPDSGFSKIAKEVSLAKKPVDVEVNLRKKPSFHMNFDPNALPSGPSGLLRKAKITSNPKVDHKVEKATGDHDLKANEGIYSLYKKGIDENSLSKVLSMGNLGIKNNRKLVPTRWSITATDDIIGKKLMDEVSYFNESDCCSFYGGNFGNYYLFLFFPGPWSYELFEIWMPNTTWNRGKKTEVCTDYENFKGRKEYAFETAGGYYAPRLAALKKMQKMKRKASVLCIRIITGEYYTPLGVFVCREAARKSLGSKKIDFSDTELMKIYAKKLFSKKFGFDISQILKDSKLLKDLENQKRLFSYM